MTFGCNFLARDKSLWGFPKIGDLQIRIGFKWLVFFFVLILKWSNDWMIWGCTPFDSERWLFSMESPTSNQDLKKKMQKEDVTHDTLVCGLSAPIFCGSSFAEPAIAEMQQIQLYNIGYPMSCRIFHGISMGWLWHVFRDDYGLYNVIICYIPSGKHG